MSMPILGMSYLYVFLRFFSCTTFAEKREMKPDKKHHSEVCYSSVEQMPEAKA